MNLPYGLKRLRNNNHLTQVEFCKILELNQSTLAMWESGERFPPVTKLSQICEIFDCSFDYLLGVSDEPERQPESEKQPMVINITYSCPTCGAKYTHSVDYCRYCNTRLMY